MLHYSPKAAQHYGSIRAALEKRGQPVGVNDLHIAAHARSEVLALVLNNLREFERVEALQLANWAIGRLGDLNPLPQSRALQTTTTTNMELALNMPAKAKATATEILMVTVPDDEIVLPQDQEQSEEQGQASPIQAGAAPCEVRHIHYRSMFTSTRVGTSMPRDALSLLNLR